MVIFDCEEKTMAAIAEKMVKEMVNKKDIRPGDQEGVLKSLLQISRYPFKTLPNSDSDINDIGYV